MEKVQGMDALRCKNKLVTRVKYVEKDAFIMGFHVHKAAWTPSNGELLSCVVELSNMMDKYADAVQDKDKKVVGHLPPGKSGKVFTYEENFLFFDSR